MITLAGSLLSAVAVPTAAQDKLPLPSVDRTCPDEPPEMITLAGSLLSAVAVPPAPYGEPFA